MDFILNILLLSVSIFIISRLMPTIHIDGISTAIVVAVVYSVANFLFGRILIWLAFPLIFITFGLFKLVINAFMLWLTDQVIEGFKIEGLGSTFIAAVLITVLDSLFQWIIF